MTSATDARRSIGRDDGWPRRVVDQGTQQADLESPETRDGGQLESTGAPCHVPRRRAWSAAQMKTACRGSRPQAAATRTGEVAGALVESSAKTTLPGKTVTSRPALANPAQRARVSRPAAQAISAMPLPKTIALRAGRTAGTKGMNSPGLTRWSAPLPAKRTAREAGARRRTRSDARPDMHPNLRPVAKLGVAARTDSVRPHDRSLTATP